MTVDTTGTPLPIRYTRGTDQDYTITFTDPDTEQPLSVADQAITFLVKADRADAAALVTKTLGAGIVLGAGATSAVLTILAADCADSAEFPDGLQRWWGVQVAPLDKILLWGPFVVVTEP